MGYPTLTVAREIKASPAAVWKVLTDLDNAPKNIKGIDAVERVDGKGYAVGVSWRETRRIFGKAQTELMEVATADKPKSTSVVSESSGTVFTTKFTLAPGSSSTRLECEFSAVAGELTVGQRILTAIFSKAGMSASKKMLEQDLADIAAAAE